jgi:DNA repair protein RadB
MMEEASTITTGSPVLDDLLNGGYETDIVTTVYGPSGSGKSNVAMLAAASHADGKVVFVDTESGLSVRRLKQLSDDAEQVLENTMVLQPTSLEEQGKAFEQLKNTLNDSVNIVIVDSIAMLYRLEVARNDDIKQTNQQLAEQSANLIRIARDKQIPVLITNQVYEDFDSGGINLVGGDILQYGSKCLIELRNDDGREAIVRKHRSMPAGKTASFSIVDEGLVPPSD